MPTVSEHISSRPSTLAVGKGSSHERVYTVTGASSEQEALEAVVNQADTYEVIGNTVLILQGVDAEYLGNDTWQCRARWGNLDSQKNEPEPQTGDQLEMEIDISAETTTLIHSYTQKKINVTTGAVTTSATGGPIKNVPGEGPQGIEVFAPATSLQIKKFIKIADIGAFVRSVSALVGTVNVAPWKSFATGEVLFLGINTRYRYGVDDWEITYRFAQRSNIASLSVAGVTVTDLQGWWTLWVRYEETVVSSVLTSTPVEVVADQIYRYSNFNVLGL